MNKNNTRNNNNKNNNNKNNKKNNTPIKTSALLFGLNYDYMPEARLNGCINDTKEMASVLKNVFNFQDVEIFDDVSNLDATTHAGILEKLRQLARKSIVQNLDYVWIHFSGHGTTVTDSNVRNESDKQNEAIVPSDFKTAGLIIDDTINSILATFNPSTHIILVIDSCHSGTMCDLQFKWKISSDRKTFTPIVENANNICRGRVIAISGCMDNQKSADFTLMTECGSWSAAGALTHCLSTAILSNPDTYTKNVFALIIKTQELLLEKGFQQIPEITSSIDIRKDPFLLPIVPSSIKSRDIIGADLEQQTIHPSPIIAYVLTNINFTWNSLFKPIFSKVISKVSYITNRAFNKSASEDITT